MTKFEGIPVSGGSRVGRALLYDETPDISAVSAAPPADVEAEVRRLLRAGELAREDLIAFLETMSRQEGIAGIFAAHAAMLDDFLPRLAAAVREGMRAERAVATVMHAFAADLAKVRNRHVAQRSQDIVDLERRLLRALSGLQPATPKTRAGGGPVVVVAVDLTPSETAALQGQGVAAIALERGGATSHTAVIAKSLGIPCVMGVVGLLDAVQPGDMLWVDGTEGTVVLEPDSATVERAVGLGERYERLEAVMLRESHLPAETLDGHRATLLANIEFPLDVEAGMARGAEGVGLFRTEFLHTPGQELPTEEEQLAAYREVLERIEGRPITIRTFDFGADKGSPFDKGPPEPNPALGMRSLRWCFAHPDAFRAQLRALLRVAAEGDVRILFPMVGGLEEMRRAKAFLREASDELTAAGVPHEPNPSVGMMIEIPGAAVLADLLAREVDFFSIGTNDLIQYDLAVDRMNPEVAPLFRPSHPSILRLIDGVINAAVEAGIPVTICGEMGTDSIYTVLLFGLGVRDFSLTPGYIPRARRLLRSLTLREARGLATQCLGLETASEVEALLRAVVTPVGAG
jgi:phosphotransferase system enzyme I (PtsI)